MSCGANSPYRNNLDGPFLPEKISPTRRILSILEIVLHKLSRVYSGFALYSSCLTATLSQLKSGSGPGGLKIWMNIYCMCIWKKIETWNSKSRCKCGRFSEELPKCGRFYNRIYNISKTEETHGQYWKIGMYDLRCNARIYIHWSFIL